MLRIGQKLKIPADGKPAAKADKAEAPKADATAKKEEIPVDAPKADDAKKDENAEAQPPAAEDAAKKDAAPGFTTYVVQEGDDMTSITIRYGVSAAEIRDLNNLPDDAQLKPGQVIKLPAEAQQ